MDGHAAEHYTHALVSCSGTATGVTTMKGNEKLLATLNALLADELTAINQEDRAAGHPGDEARGEAHYTPALPRGHAAR